MKTIRLTAAQALVKFLGQQFLETEYLETKSLETDAHQHPIFAGVFAIFGHGNVAGLGEALYHTQDTLPTYRAHNEQSMAHAAIAFAKASHRRRVMACTTSIGPGATNMLTAAALAHVNRLPVLFIPGDVFASRTPDPVLQQLEDSSDPTLSVNDCFKPVSRYFDRISRPEQLINSLPMMVQTLLDPINCGPVTLAFPQDVQTQAFDYPASLFEKRVHRIRQQGPDKHELAEVLAVIRQAKRPLMIAGGGVKYALAYEALAEFSVTHNLPIAETQAGKGSLNWQHPCAVGGIGVTGSLAANSLAEQADVVIAIGTRLQDFTTQSRTLFEDKGKTLIQLNVGQFDATKHHAMPLVSDALIGLQQLSEGLTDWQASPEWLSTAQQLNQQWQAYYESVTNSQNQNDNQPYLPSDAQVLGAIKRQSETSDVILCAAGGLPGELHKLWRAEDAVSYHLEYGFSCMGYEIAGGLGVKIAHPEREVIVVVGDGSYMMMNSELATSVMLGYKIIVVVLDNRGFGCINRLQNGTGNASFNNLFEHCKTTEQGAPKIDFAAHAQAMGVTSESVDSLQALEQGIQRARASDSSYLIAIDTDPAPSADNGDAWWDVAIPEVSASAGVNQAFEQYQVDKQKQPY